MGNFKSLTLEDDNRFVKLTEAVRVFETPYKKMYAHAIKNEQVRLDFNKKAVADLDFIKSYIKDYYEKIGKSNSEIVEILSRKVDLVRINGETKKYEEDKELCFITFKKEGRVLTGKIVGGVRKRVVVKYLNMEEGRYNLIDLAFSDIMEGEDSLIKKIKVVNPAYSFIKEK